MTKSEVLEITKGDDFTPTYFAKFKRVSYECFRVTPGGKEAYKELWDKGTYGSWELYNYKRNGYYGKYAHIKHTSNSLNDEYAFEKREDCIKFAEPKGISNSHTVYVY